jgi:hypothetical protein
MHRIAKIIAGLTLAAGTFGATAAFGMGDGYTTNYYYTTPGTSYYYSSPGTTYQSAPYGYSGTYGYYDNVYNPYWSYDGPLGQGSGHDMRIGH